MVYMPQKKHDQKLQLEYSTNIQVILFLNDQIIF